MQNVQSRQEMQCKNEWGAGSLEVLRVLVLVSRGAMAPNVKFWYTILKFLCQKTFITMEFRVTIEA